MTEYCETLDLKNKTIRVFHFFHQTFFSFCTFGMSTTLTQKQLLETKCLEKSCFLFGAVLCARTNTRHFLLSSGKSILRARTVFQKLAPGTDSVLIKFVKRFDMCGVFEFFSIKIKVESAQN